MDIILKSQAREPKERLSVDFVPAILYGRGVASVSLKVRRGDLDKVVGLAGESNLILLEHEGGKVKVLIKEIQRSGLNGSLLHVDFFQVNMTSKINTEIPLHFVGESKAIKEMSGSLIKDIDSLEVECLPGDLVDHIDVDISVLKEFHDEISTSDLILPKGIELASDVNRIIASVIPPRVQEAVVEAAPVTATKEEPKTEDKK
ncbi:MAG: 50S ribosomal protein L25 [Candidatus Falkowbacteria bacterium]